MNLALVLGPDPARLHELSTRLEGLGLVVDTCSDATELSGYPASPRVVVWDLGLPRASAARLPAAVRAAPIHLRISPLGNAIPDIESHPASSTTESDLLQALLNAGYCLPEDSECAAIPNVLHGLVDGDSAVVAELIDSLTDTGLADLAAYRVCCADQDWTGAGTLAHRIKGTARLAGCASLTQLCEHVEAVTRNGDGAQVERLNTLFEPSLQRLCNQLHRLQLAR